MTEPERKLEQAKRAYEASGTPFPPTIGRLVRLPLAVASESEIDVDLVRRAREDVWRRLPKVHRANQADLAARVRDARLLGPARAWTWGSPCLLMSGPTESGKSSAAALVVLRAIAKGREADAPLWRGIRWYGANELMRHAREWSLGAGECPEVRQASTCGLLILDDLGNEQEWQTTTFDLLQARYERGLPNIVTTGLRPAQLIERYGDAVLRRIIQRNGKMGTLVDCWGGK